MNTIQKSFLLIFLSALVVHETGLAMEASFSDLPEEILKNEIIKPSLQSGSITERRHAWNTWARLSKKTKKLLNEIPFNERIWMVSKTPKELQERKRIDCLAHNEIVVAAGHGEFFQIREIIGKPKDIEYIYRINKIYTIEDIFKKSIFTKKEAAELLRYESQIRKVSSKLFPYLIALTGDHIDTSLHDDFPEQFGDTYQYNRNALLWTVLRHHVTAMKHLLAAGANPNKKEGNRGLIPTAITRWNHMFEDNPEAKLLETLKLLIAYGARMDQDDPSPLIDAQIEFAGNQKPEAQEILKLLKQQEKSEKQR